MKTTYQPTGETWADRAPKVGDLALAPMVGAGVLRVAEVVPLSRLIASASSPASAAYHQRKNPRGLVKLESLDGRYGYTLPRGDDDERVTHMTCIAETDATRAGGRGGG